MAGPIKKVADINLGSRSLSVWTDVGSLKKQVRKMGKGGVSRASMRALNRAAAKTKTFTGRLLAKEFNIKVGDIKKYLSVSPRASLRSDAVGIKGTSAQLGIYKHAKGVKRQGPLGVRFNAGGGSKVHKHTFIARMPSGHVGVFVRADKGAGKRTTSVSKQGRVVSTQLPIRELTYPPIAQMITNDVRGGLIFKSFINDYPQQLFTQLDFEQKKSKQVI